MAAEAERMATDDAKDLPAKVEGSSDAAEKAKVPDDSKQTENVTEELEEGEIPLEKTHPQLMELSRRNGQINRMNVVQMRKELSQSGLTTYGNKQVLRKRLKAAALRDVLKQCKDQKLRNKLVGRNRAPRFLVVLDFEATCGEHGNVVIPADSEGKKPKVNKQKPAGPTFTEKLRLVRESMSRSRVENADGSDDAPKPVESESATVEESSETPVVPLKQLAEQVVEQLNSEPTEEAESPVKHQRIGQHEQIQEIIEFPAYFVDTHELRVVGAPFQSFVKPSHPANRRLTEFCTSLTGIVQSDVDSAPSFPEVLVSFKRWLGAMLRSHDPRVIRRAGFNIPEKTTDKADANNNSSGDTAPQAGAGNAVDLNRSFMESALMHLRALQEANETVSETRIRRDPVDGNAAQIADVSDQLAAVSLNDAESSQSNAAVNVDAPRDITIDERDEDALEYGDFALLFDSAVDVSVFLRTSAAVSGVKLPNFMREWVNVKKIYCNFYTLPKASLSDMLRSLQMDFVGRAHRGRDDALNIGRLALRLVEDGASLKKNERLLDRPANERGGRTAENNPNQVRVRYYEPIRSDAYSRRKKRRESDQPEDFQDEPEGEQEHEEEVAQDDLLYLHSLKRSTTTVA